MSNHATAPEQFDIITDFGRVFWKNMPLNVALDEARNREPYLGAWQVVPTSTAAHGARY